MAIREVYGPLRLLLLFSTLSSAPMGSMEQGAPEVVGAGNVQLLPALRLDSAAVIGPAASKAMGSSDVEAPRIVGAPGHDTHSLDRPSAETHGLRPARPRSTWVRAGHDLLPYYPIPPPFRA